MSPAHYDPRNHGRLAVSRSRRGAASTHHCKQLRTSYFSHAYQARPYPPHEPPGTLLPHSNDGVVPMDIDAMTTRPRPLTDAEKEKCRQENRCFFCRRTGHSIAYCPLKPCSNCRKSGHIITACTLPRAQTVAEIHEVTPSQAAASPPPTADLITSALALHSTDRLHLINSLMLLDNVPDMPCDALHINQIVLPSVCPSPTVLLPPLSLPAPSLPPANVSPPACPATALALLVTSTDERPPLPSSAPASPTTSPPPRPPRSPLHPYSPCIPSALSNVVEDDNVSTGGVKTSSSVLNTQKDEDDWALFVPRPTSIPDIANPVTRPVQYPPLFLSRALEQPRDLDEIVLNGATRTQCMPHTTPLPTSRPDSPRPSNEPIQHAMVRTRKQQPRTRKPTSRPPQQSTINPVILRNSNIDITTPHVLRCRPHITFSENRDRHTSRETQRPIEDATPPPPRDEEMARRQHIEEWRARIVMELPTQLHHPDPIGALRRSTTNLYIYPDPRNYAYDYDYPDARRED
ncbi:hypothetical protein EDB92DRAFT_1083303 [Lactarius akahatsu]|uniref:CCHC-type domain-containing protein n=1 Tax=Lactarius akahatsu TaxID=416441 RepID=A0AAD4LGW7_9AGAM|nr:hypothetical protein EDB92DRAFT_1083303 [Lactarius akahatsu]